MAQICPGCDTVHEGDERLCDACQAISLEEDIAYVQELAKQQEEEAGAHADWEASQASEAEADAWHSQYD